MEFDTSKIKLSKYDVKRRLTLPKKPSKELAEFIGILIGDGYLYNNFNKYRIGIVGNPKTDFKYFLKIQNLIYKLFNIKIKIKIRGRGLRIIFGSKGTFNFLTKIIGLDYGKGKGAKVRIPSFIIENEDILNYTIKGIFDTDGTIFTSNKKGCPDYPTIELTTTSLQLAEQVKEILIKKEFNVAGVRKHKYKQSKYLISNKVSLYGKNNAKKWFTHIGFSNHNKQRKLKNIILKNIIKNGDAGNSRS